MAEGIVLEPVEQAMKRLIESASDADPGRSVRHSASSGKEAEMVYRMFSSPRPAGTWALAAALWFGLARAHAADEVVVEDGGIRANNIVASGVITGMGSVPVGAILMWSGSIDALPAGWVLCDGNNDSPNLSGRFIVGYEAEKPGKPGYKVGDGGGAAQRTLTIAEMPSHRHSATTQPAGAHTHELQVSEKGWAFYNWVASGDGNAKQKKKVPLPKAGEHAHGVDVQSTGGGKAFDIRPPYFALAYIMYKGMAGATVSK